MNLRTIIELDLEAAAAVHAQCFEDGWDAAVLGGLLKGFGAFGYCVTDAANIEKLSGFVLARAIGDEIEILTIAVAPSAWRRGIGGRLLDQILERAKSNGVERVILEVAADAHAAQRLYQSRHFKRIATRAGYYRRSASLVDANVLEFRDIHRPKV